MPATRFASTQRRPHASIQGACHAVTTVYTCPACCWPASGRRLSPCNNFPSPCPATPLPSASLHPRHADIPYAAYDSTSTWPLPPPPRRSNNNPPLGRHDGCLHCPPVSLLLSTPSPLLRSPNPSTKHRTMPRRNARHSQCWAKTPALPRRQKAPGRSCSPSPSRKARA